MALTNIEKQARWRERHADRRHAVARIATMLTRQRFSDGITHEIQLGWNTCTIDGYFVDLAKLIGAVLKTDKAIKQLRWALAKCLRDRKRVREWLRENPGMTEEDYQRLLCANP
jgi:hypothetical protein